MMTRWSREDANGQPETHEVEPVWAVSLSERCGICRDHGEFIFSAEGGVKYEASPQRRWAFQCSDE